MSNALDAFQPHRPRLMRVAYRMLGTMSDAEDVVQDAYLRWHQSEPRAAVRSDEAFLVTTVTRLAIDRLRRLKTEREAYFGEWLPEPFTPDARSAEPGHVDDLSYAALVLLERLSPDERAAFLLREVFDLDYDSVADTLVKSEAACRKLVQRAKEKLAEHGPLAEPRPVSRDEQRLLVRQLLAATRAQHGDELTRLLSDAVQLVSDGGGKVFAARYVLSGAARVGRALWQFVHKLGGPRIDEQVVELAGEPAIVTYVDGALNAVTFFAVAAGQVQAIYKVLNPEKLAALGKLLPAP